MTVIEEPIRGKTDPPSNKDVEGEDNKLPVVTQPLGSKETPLVVLQPKKTVNTLTASNPEGAPETRLKVTSVVKTSPASDSTKEKESPEKAIQKPPRKKARIQAAGVATTTREPLPRKLRNAGIISRFQPQLFTVAKKGKVTLRG
jgi:hypothetical protein